NGLGERAGNAALEEVVMAMRVRHDIMPYDTGIDATRIMAASRMVSQITGFPVQFNKAIVGKNAFAHESGIHQDGVLKHAGTYEIMKPEDVGLVESNLVMGKHSGRAAFRAKLNDLGIEAGDNQLEDAFVRFKALADTKKEVFDDDIVALLNETASDGEKARVKWLEVVCGTRRPRA
ncbi:MAG: 2-isopropylmalate synthase, partial [Pseudomonadota bacterium]